MLGSAIAIEEVVHWIRRREINVARSRRGQSERSEKRPLLRVCRRTRSIPEQNCGQCRQGLRNKQPRAQTGGRPFGSERKRLQSERNLIIHVAACTGAGEGRR